MEATTVGGAAHGGYCIISDHPGVTVGIDGVVKRVDWLAVILAIDAPRTKLVENVAIALWPLLHSPRLPRIQKNRIIASERTENRRNHPDRLEVCRAGKRSGW